MFKYKKQCEKLKEEIEVQDKEYNSLLKKVGILEKEIKNKEIENEKLIKAKKRYQKKVKELKKELKEVSNEK